MMNEFQYSVQRKRCQGFFSHATSFQVIIRMLVTLIMMLIFIRNGVLEELPTACLVSFINIPDYRGSRDEGIYPPTPVLTVGSMRISAAPRCQACKYLDLIWI